MKIKILTTVSQSYYNKTALKLAALYNYINYL